MTTKQKTKRNPVQPTATTREAIVWISSIEAAERIGIKPKTLDNWRCTQLPDQPTFYKSGHFVRYKLSEVDAWIESHRRQF